MIYAVAKKLRKNDVVVVKDTKKKALVKSIDKSSNYIKVHTDMGTFYANELE